MTTLSGTGPTVELVHVQEDTVEIESNIITVNLFASNPGDTFLLPLTAADEGSPDGIVTADAVGGRGALAQWLANLESHVGGSIGSSSSITHPHRGRSVNGQVREVAWEIEGGAPYEASWDLTFVVGRGLNDLGLPFEVDFGSGWGPEGTSPSSSGSVAGQDLGQIQSYRVRCEQDLTTFNIPQFGEIAGFEPSIDDNLAFPTGGVTRTFTINGRKTSGIESFESTMRSNSGDMLNTFNYSEAFPGRSFSVAIQNYTGDMSAAETGVLEYSLELVEGRSLTDLADIVTETIDGVTG